MLTSVLFQRFVMLSADEVQEVYLFNDLLVQVEDIMRLDVRGSVLLQEGQLIAEIEHCVKDRLFLRVEWSPHCWRVAHIKDLAPQCLQYNMALPIRERRSGVLELGVRIKVKGEGAGSLNAVWSFVVSCDRPAELNPAQNSHVMEGLSSVEVGAYLIRAIQAILALRHLRLPLP